MKELSETEGAHVAPIPKRKYKRKATTTVEIEQTGEPGTIVVTPSLLGQGKSAMHDQLEDAIISDSELSQYILGQLEVGEPKAVVLAGALEMNRNLETPVKNDEVLELMEKVIATIDREMDGHTLFRKIIEQLTLFRDDLSEPHYFCEGIPFRAPSRYVEAWAKNRYLRIKNYLPDAKMVRNEFDMLESVARFDSPQIRLFNRVARKDGAIIYDLCDKRYLKATDQGWEIVQPYPLFRRYKHQQAQIEPVSGGDPWDVFDFLTVPEESRLLVLVYLISLFVPGIAHPVFAVCGDQGSSKSFFCTVINRLVDPTLTEKIIQPKNERDLIQTLRQKYLTVLDNISTIDHRVSDILCQVCTGGGVSYRQLYTDEGENIAQFRHVVIINSISLPIVNADLMDRSIILKLQRIKPEDRKPEQDLWDAFNAAHPRIMGGIFDTLAKAMALMPTVKIDHLPRLADFAKWGYAIAEALGNSGEKFLEDFTRNVEHQNESVTEKNVLSQSILTLMVDESAYLNTVADTHKELKKIAGEDAKDTTFPKLPHHLRSQLERLRSTLHEHGISYQFFDRQKTGVKILFNKAGSSASSGTPASPEPVPNRLISGMDEPGVAGVATVAPPLLDFGGDFEVANV